MDNKEQKLKQQIKADLDRIPSVSLASVAKFVQNLLKPNNHNQEKVVSLYGCMKANPEDDQLEQVIKQSREEIVEGMGAKIKRWIT
jgi:hypothetical protein